MNAPIYPAPRELKDLRAWLESLEEDLITFDGLDEAILGVVTVHTRGTVVLYDRAKAIELLAKEGMDFADAEEYFDFNIGCAYLGERTPAFAELWKDVRDGL